MNTPSLIVAVCVVGLSAQIVSAQWLEYRTPGTPRNADGTANLSAPAPRTSDGKPDLSGVWRSVNDGYNLNITASLKPEDFQPWAATLSKERALTFGNGSPSSRCLPSGPTLGWFQGLSKIIQTSNVIVILRDADGNLHRQIFLDGRTLPSDPHPTWLGYSVGRWDGDTLVVESNGFNDKTWLDGTGHPHSESLHVTERLRRTDFGHIQLQITIDDPKAYVKPWTVPVDVRLIPDTDLLESVCHENELTTSHTVAPPRTVRLEPAVLARFVGTYDAGPGREFVVTLEGDQLFMRRPGFKVGVAMFPVSETSFLNGGAQVQFGHDPGGNVSQLVFMNVEGETTATRRK
jgi:hypothetical protein